MIDFYNISYEDNLYLLLGNKKNSDIKDIVIINIVLCWISGERYLIQAEGKSCKDTFVVVGMKVKDMKVQKNIIDINKV